jgi:hypothetical protein
VKFAIIAGIEPVVIVHGGAGSVAAYRVDTFHHCFNQI